METGESRALWKKYPPFGFLLYKMNFDGALYEVQLFLWEFRKNRRSIYYILTNISPISIINCPWIFSKTTEKWSYFINEVQIFLQWSIITNRS